MRKLEGGKSRPVEEVGHAAHFGLNWGFRDRSGAVILAAANDVGSASHR